MLPTTAQHRLYRHVPGNKWLAPTERDQLDIDYYTPTGEYVQARDVAVDVFWAEEDHTPRYPAVALELGPCGVQRYDNNQLTDTVEKLAHPDETIAYERLEGTKLYDVLTLTVLVGEDYVTDTGQVIEQGAFAKEVAQAMFASFRFETDYLNEPGVARDGAALFEQDAHVDAEDWSQPMVIEPIAGTGITPNHAMVDEQHTHRYVMEFEVAYELTHSVLVEATEAIEWSLAIDGNPVTHEAVVVARPTTATGRPQTAWQGDE